MLNFFSSLFNTEGFRALFFDRHWPRTLVWLHILSALATWAAFTTTLVALNYYILRRKNAPAPRAFWIFEGFLFASGTLFLVQAILFGWPIYRFVRSCGC